ncbi:MAG: hypothetical protein KBT76_08035 [Sulfitobacter litoralis]|nr:hypothetical protein [Sulfitobacter litoralis]MBQ0801675.1 hypothetical protein [Sulfitobacter litoralis]|tara:strand:+ start:396 stop:668 length:273 start_codon:yes stop_codon:yes gene_type:complete
MKKAIALTVGVSLANIFGPVPAFADNPQTVTSERTARNQDSPEAMYNNIIDRANSGGRTTESIPFIGKILPGYKQGSKASRSILEDSKFE